MTTADVARQLGVSSEFIRREIVDGRLRANTANRDGKRKVYRITPEQLTAYRATYWDVPRETYNQ
jgi:excisionase family DNA binding protein